MNLDYLARHPERVLELTIQHLGLSAAAMALALLLAVPLGLLATRYRRLTLPMLSALGALYTIPSLAFLAFLIPSLGLGRTPALVVLATYAQIFLVRNIVAGLRGVDPSAVEAGRGLGMTEWQLFRSVRWPLALPVAISGMRIAFTSTIGLASIAAWINAGGLGTLLFEGITRDDPSRILVGGLAVTAIALVADGLLRLAERSTAIARARRAVA